MATAAIEMRPLKISEDRKGFFALMPSQSGGKPHRVGFYEPAKSMPCDFSCDCKGYQFRLHCSHCDALKSYFSEIYERHDRWSEQFQAAAKPVETTPPPVVSTPELVDAKEALAEEIEALLQELEQECDAIVAEVDAEQASQTAATQSEDMTVQDRLAEIDMAAYKRSLEAMSLGKLKAMIKKTLGYTYGYPTKKACIYTLCKRYELGLKSA